MDFSFTDEQQATADLARQILSERQSHERLREIERGPGPRYDAETWAVLAEAGLLGIAVAEQYGGAGLGLMEIAQVLVAAGRAGAALPLWETLGLGVVPIARFGDEDTCSRWLGAVVAGTAVLTAGWHDDDRDPTRRSVTARSADDGWIVSGTKICVPAGAIADAVVLPAVSALGPVLALVDLSAEGVSREALVTTADSPDADLTFDDVPATVLAVGQADVVWARERALATQCALALGNAEAMLDLLAAYTKERKQFDVPIATFQAVAHRAADSYIDTEAIRLTTWAALSRLADGDDAPDDVAIAKYWAATSGNRIALAAAHLHGGVGVDRDYPLARHFTRAKEIELQLGGATEHLLSLGRSLAV